MKVATLSGLPEELLLEVFGNFVLGFGETDASPLCALSLVSKKLARAAQERLYQHIDIWRWQDGRLLCLLRTLIDVPELARKAKSLTLTVAVIPGNGDEHLIKKGRGKFSDLKKQELVMRFLARLQSFDKVDEHGRFALATATWRKNIAGNVTTALGGLLVTLLPNLRHLLITVITRQIPGRAAREPLRALFGISSDDAQALADITTATPIMAGLRSVRKFQINGRNTHLLRLPFEALEWLVISLIDSDEHSNLWHYTNGLADTYILPLPRLKLLNVNSDWSELDENHPLEPCVARLVSSLGCINLEQFEFTLWYRPPAAADNRLFGNFAKLIMSLSIVSHTLESLIIQVNRSCPPEYMKRLLPIATIRHFERLKVLRIVEQALVHRDYGKRRYAKQNIADILPLSLRELTIIYPTKKLVRWLEDLVGVGQCLPRFRSIELVCHSGYGKSSSWFKKQAVLRELQRAGTKVRVSDHKDQPKEIVDDDMLSFWDEDWGDDKGCITRLFEEAVAALDASNGKLESSQSTASNSLVSELGEISTKDTLVT